jgi:hypothetical protein
MYVICINIFYILILICIYFFVYIFRNKPLNKLRSYLQMNTKLKRKDLFKL